MDSAFLVLVAIPLGVYLVALVLSSRGTLGQVSPKDAARAERQATEALAAAYAESYSVHAREHELEAAQDFDAAAALSETTGTISDKLISSEVVLGHEPVSAQDTPTPALAFESAAQVETVSTASIESEIPATAGAMSPDPVAPSSATFVAETSSAPTATSESVVSAQEPEAARLVPVAEATTESVAAESATPAAAIVSEPLETEALEPDQDDPILPEGPIQLPDKGSPKYAFDYRGRLWVEKKNKGFFRQLRRPQLPPEDPTNGR